MTKLIRVKDFNRFELSDMLAGQILELLVDTKKKEVYHVHPPVGHAKAAMIYLRTEKIDSEKAGHLVSALIQIEKGVVKKLRIGASSLEFGYKIKHTTKQLDKAAEIIESIINLSKQIGEILIAEDFKVEYSKAA